MSGKCIVISSCILFLAITSFASLSPFLFWGYYFNNQDNGTLILQPKLPYGNSLVICKLYQIFTESSLRSFIQATTACDQDFRLNGLALYSKLTNACQPLADVSKAKVQSHKVALVILRNNDQRRCPFQKLAVNAQNAGYTVLITFGHSPYIFSSSTHEDKLLIPVLNVKDHECKQPGRYEDKAVPVHHLYSTLSKTDLTNVEIRVPEPRPNELIQMLKYLDKLYYWFLVGPIITLEWLRRTKKFCCMSGGQQLNNNGQTDENEAEMRTMEEGGSRTEGSHLHSTIENSYRDRDGEEQPLLTTQPTVINDYTRQPRGTGYVNIIRKISLKIAVGFLYLILVVVALPAGISFGGLSFFRFDNAFYPGPYITFWDTVWPTLQIFCFFMYSRFACKNTWTIQTEFSKLSRSDWFASNIYLLVLGVVVPYCFFTNRADVPFGQTFSHFVIYNTVCTVCNVLFILILNKHKVVTRYVFYISICMICAYIESDIVAVFYFALNSEGSLANLKLTALRTVAIGLTLTISFNSSMHIVRKLVKPQESLFEGLGEK